MIKAHVTLTLSGAAQRLALASPTVDEEYQANIYAKFMSVAPGVKRLFQLSEKTPSFGDILFLYRTSRVKLLTPLISGPQLTVPDLRPRASVVLGAVVKEYKLAEEFFNFQGHPLYTKSFADIIDDVGHLFCESCCSLLLRTSEIKHLCDVCIVLKGDVLQEEIGRIPVAPEKLRVHFQQILTTAQERLLFRVEAVSSELTVSSERTIEIISLLYYALPSESFGEIACNLLTACLSSLQSEVRRLPDRERDVFLLSHYLTLREKIRNLDGQIVGTTQVIDFEPLSDFLWRLLRFDSSLYQLGGDRGFVRSFAGLSRVVSSSVDAKKQVESATSLAFQSFSSYATQLLAQPLLNLKARDAREKKQILEAVEGVQQALTDHFEQEIAELVKKYITNKGHLAAVLDVFHGHLCQVCDDCAKWFGEIDDETQTAIARLQTQIKSLNF
jgi:hypothetical protein